MFADKLNRIINHNKTLGNIMFEKEIHAIAKAVVTVITFPFVIFMSGVDNYITLISTNKKAYMLHVALLIFLVGIALLYRFL